MRLVVLLGLFGCAPGERWALRHLGPSGARALEKEARAALERQPDPPSTSEPHCAGPRVLIEVSDFIPYQLTYSALNDDPSIGSVAQVRCLVLYTHHGQEMAHHPETRLTVRVVDRASGALQLTNVRDHKGALEAILGRL